jgi:hypothetical protein
MTHKYVKRIVKNNMHLPPQDGAVKKRWTIEDMKYLLAHSTTDFIDDIALELGRTLKATKDKAFLMGCSIKSKGTTK